MMHTPADDSGIVLRRLYVGHLPSNAISDGLVQLFGLGTTPAMQAATKVEWPTYENSEQPKHFVIVNAPEHVYHEILKLNGMLYEGQHLSIEDAKAQDDYDKACDERRHLSLQGDNATKFEKYTSTIILNVRKLTIFMSL